MPKKAFLLFEMLSKKLVSRCCVKISYEMGQKSVRRKTLQMAWRKSKI